jgi:Tfp pilus assembly protein PilF
MTNSPASYDGSEMKILAFLIFLPTMVSCAAPGHQAVDGPLKAPSGAAPTAVAALDAGNSLFEAGQWEQAHAQYEVAVTAEPMLAEAHYDLALALDRLGRKNEAVAHYRRAANLAPGNRVIWNAPPFRRVDTEVGKSRSEKRKPRLDPPGTY